MAVTVSRTPLSISLEERYGLTMADPVPDDYGLEFTPLAAEVTVYRTAERSYVTLSLLRKRNWGTRSVTYTDSLDLTANEGIPAAYRGLVASVINKVR